MARGGARGRSRAAHNNAAVRREQHYCTDYFGMIFLLKIGRRQKTIATGRTS
jgi:hypothetical protein